MRTSGISLAGLALVVAACSPAVTAPSAPAASAPSAGATAAPGGTPATPSSPGDTPTTTPGAAVTDDPSPSGPMVATIRTKDSPLGGCGAVTPRPFILHGDPAGNDEGEQVWLEPGFEGGQLAAIFPYAHTASF